MASSRNGSSTIQCSVTPSRITLAELASRLVEIHGQHEHQALLARNSQLDLLDAFARNEGERTAVRDAARRWTALLREREQLSGQGDVSDRINYLEHQLAELQREDLAPAALSERLGQAAGGFEALCYGVAAVRETFEPYLESGELVSVLDGYLKPYPGFYLYFPNRRNMAPKLRALVDHVQRYRRGQRSN